jgi:hypothetical protein
VVRAAADVVLRAVGVEGRDDVDLARVDEVRELRALEDMCMIERTTSTVRCSRAWCWPT